MSDHEDCRLYSGDDEYDEMRRSDSFVEFIECMSEEQWGRETAFTEETMQRWGVYDRTVATPKRRAAFEEFQPVANQNDFGTSLSDWNGEDEDNEKR